MAIAVAEALKRVHEQGRAFGQLHPSHIALAGGKAVLSAGRPEVTPYTAPEQLQGAHPDGRSDIFSLGALLYRMLSGRDPFLSAKPGDLRREILQCDPAPLSAIPAPLARTVRLCMEKQQERRFQRIQLLLAELKLQALRCGGEMAGPAGSEDPEPRQPLGPVAIRTESGPVEDPDPPPPQADAARPALVQCPKCGSSDIRRSRPRGAAEKLMALAGFRVRRCFRCYHRFLRFGSVAVEKPE